MNKYIKIVSALVKVAYIKNKRIKEAFIPSLSAHQAQTPKNCLLKKFLTISNTIYYKLYASNLVNFFTAVIICF